MSYVHGAMVRSHHVSYNTLAVTCTVGNRTRVTQAGCLLELITFEILAAEQLRLMAFDNRLIIDCFANVVNILIWQFSTNDRFKSEKYESITWKIHFQK